IEIAISIAIEPLLFPAFSSCLEFFPNARTFPLRRLLVAVSDFDPDFDFDYSSKLGIEQFYLVEL
ncbi:MAG: hypothetical protein Q8R88_10820, partial [Desulfoprunum sp.]|nr:hypothetical protein [Desulfoprunum sp.]